MFKLKTDVMEKILSNVKEPLIYIDETFGYKDGTTFETAFRMPLTYFEEE